eukprot:CAMPEP_0168807308 /NCGR_PEP_ID=MMETSP0726-20121227/1989_1 /TAXON_ID=265536 /ORGANISM="Amphiprora sp., Strain CCMP467" /LENGTH=930 /DNA_ID=CAMNT_0008859229 /DNA_START=68 /DNA_END=2861 /DNA_ORIENTATION=+
MADLYGDFHDDEDLEDNEDDIGALGSILSWDEDDEEDGQAVNRTAAAMSAALRERDNAPGTSAPPDMVLAILVKDGVPQFNFLSNNSLMNSGAATPQLPQQNSAEGNNSSITLQLPMPTPISKFEAYPQQQQQTQQQIKENTSESASNDAAAAPTNAGSLKQQQQPQQSAVTQQQQQQQTQQSLAATFAQLLAQQAGTLFQQNNQAPQQQQQNQQANQPNAQTAGQQQTAAQPPPVAKPQQQQQPSTQQQQQPATIQQQIQQLQQQAQQAAQLQQTQANLQQQTTQQQQPQAQPVQAPAPANNPPGLPAVQPQQAQAQVPQLQIPFSTDPNTFLQQLQFAQFQHQLQMQAQQQQTQAQPQQQQQQQQGQNFVPNAGAVASIPAMQFPPQTTQATPLNPRPPREGPPPAKRAKKSKAAPKSAPAKKNAATTSSASPLLAAASVAAKAGIVSASDTDCDGPAAKKASNKTTDGKKSTSHDPLDNPNLSTDDKAQANRDRNREHARNTRLRKKAYLEKLKTTVEELCRERDTLVSERTGAASLLVEMHNTRTEVLMSFFALRSSNEKRRKLWSSILDESSFTCAMPVTPYRSFPASEVQVSKCQRTIMGIDGMMADTSSLHVLFDSLVDKKRFPNATIEFRYTLVTEESVVAGNQMMARWVMSTVNAIKYGALTEVTKQGMLCCKFNSAHRIIGLELMFDVMAFMLQLKQAAGSDSFSVIPNTVQTCQRTFDKPMVMTLAEPPYTIVQVNKLWEDMTGYTAEEVVGKKSCMILQGQNTDKGTLSKMMEDIRFKRPSSVHITNAKKTGQDFRHFLLSFPLSTDSRVTHYVALSNHVEDLKESPPAAQQHQIPAAPVAAATKPAMAITSQPATSIAPPNVASPALPQMFVAAPTPMVFQPQPQQVGSNNFHIGSSMLPPPNVPTQTVIHPTLMKK